MQQLSLPQLQPPLHKQLLQPQQQLQPQLLQPQKQLQPQLQQQLLPQILTQQHPKPQLQPLLLQLIMFGVNLVHGVHVHIFVTMEQDQEKGIVHISNPFTLGRNVQGNLKKLRNVILILA